jgi:hypothetical protein
MSRITQIFLGSILRAPLTFPGASVGADLNAQALGLGCQDRSAMDAAAVAQSPMVFDQRRPIGDEGSAVKLGCHAYFNTAVMWPPRN